MKLTVKTLKGSHFDIRVQPSDTIIAVKKTIEDIQGKDNYPCGQQLLIHNGKVLKDESTLAENKVSEDGFLVVMLSKVLSLQSDMTLISTSLLFTHLGIVVQICGQSKTLGIGAISSAQATSATMPASNSSPVVPEAIVTALAPNSTASVSDTILNNTSSENYSQSASNLVPDNSFEETIQQIMDMGGGSWDKETVTRALQAAYNNPERAVDYLYSGIPAITDVGAPIIQDGNNISTVAGVTTDVPMSVAPNSSPLNMFLEETDSAGMAGGLGSLDFLRNNPQFQALRSMVQSNPQILQPMLLELGKQNPQLLRLIQEHHQEFLQLINEPVDGSGGDSFDQPEDMPRAISVTPEEEATIERLEAMGFDRALVIEAFLACDRNEELAINYLLENVGDYED